jgi:cytochrome P450
MAAFRASVSRFAGGSAHSARRRAVESALAPIDPAFLRRETRRRLSAVLGEKERVDLMPILRTLPIAVLAEAMGVPAGSSAEAARLTALVAPAYPPGAPREAETIADDAVVRLKALLQPSAEDAAGEGWVAVACALVQACDATAGLVANALVAGGPGEAEEVLERAMHVDPPVRATGRAACEEVELGGQVIAAGDPVLLDLAAATGDPEGDGQVLIFGAGIRPCPGEDLALALAAGALEAVAGCEIVEVQYGEPGNLRVPVRLEVIA